jgi:hypothetical protein
MAEGFQEQGRFLFKRNVLRNSADEGLPSVPMMFEKGKGKMPLVRCLHPIEAYPKTHFEERKPVLSESSSFTPLSQRDWSLHFCTSPPEAV